MLEVDFHPFPSLTTERLELRNVKESDARMIFKMRSEIAVMRYIDRPPYRDISEAEDLVNRMISTWQTNDAVAWTICLKRSNDLIGNIGFWRMNKANFRAEIGYQLMPEFWNRGIMDEAMKAVIPYMFSKGFHSLEADVNPANSASIRLLEKNGFVREAYFRENFYYDGKFLDSAIYSLLNPT